MGRETVAETVVRAVGIELYNVYIAIVYIHAYFFYTHYSIFRRYGG